MGVYKDNKRQHIKYKHNNYGDEKYINILIMVMMSNIIVGSE